MTCSNNFGAPCGKNGAGGVTTRRQFVTRGVLALAGLGTSARGSVGMGGMAGIRSVIPKTAAARRLSHYDWLPDPPPDDQFRSLALVAMDAAKQAGADFADIRIGVQRECGRSDARMALGYGIRARVAGAWSFEHGTVLTNDAVAARATAAVIGARMASAVNAKLGWRAAEPLADVPVVTGEWHVPVDIDPFAVPIDDFDRMRGTFSQPTLRLGRYADSDGYLSWQLETRIFASTDGSLVTQSFTRGGPHISVGATLPDDEGRVDFDLLRPDGASVGFEVMLRTDFTDRIVAAAEEAIRWRELRVKRFDDVGRFPVVFDGPAFANLVGNTLNFALDPDRLSGNEADASGRSFLQLFSAHPIQPPPEFSPLLTMTSHRALPSSTAVRWDDDGVASEPSTLVDRGTVVDVHATRDTAPLFESWHRRHHRLTHLHGSCVAPTPASLPMANGGDVQVAPASMGASTPLALARDMTHGFLVMGAYTQTSSGLTTGLLQSPLIVEIINGKPTARLGNLQMAFTTNAILKSGLTALGDERTLGTAIARTFKGMPWQEMTNPVTAPAALCKEIDILRTDLSR